ncbi:MAG: hypothetical protein ACJA0V_003324 [Planctomycetota bacterium]|jgi:hypothetical protein
MKNSRALCFFLFTIVFASATSRLVAQIDPCYCILHATWDVIAQRWEADECAGNCLALEGACVNEDEIIDGTEFIWCDCDNTTADPRCFCKGKVRNPGYAPGQAAPLIICETISPCSLVFQTCNPNHLLTPPGIGWPICQCQ